MSRFKPLSIHVELIIDNDCWKIIQEKCKKNEVKVWHVMTPVNYDFYKYFFNIKMSQKEIAKIMKRIYLWMKENGQNIQLHIHLSLIMKNMTYKEQERLFKKSLYWVNKELGIKPTEFVPGWWNYNKDTLKLCKKYGLKMIRERDYDYVHDYHWVL